MPFPSPGDLPNPGIEPRSPALQADSLPAKAQGKPKNTGVGSLFPSPGDLPNPGIKPGSPALQADSLPTELKVYLVVCDIFYGLHKHGLVCLSNGLSRLMIGVL